MENEIVIEQPLVLPNKVKELITFMEPVFGKNFFRQYLGMIKGEDYLAVEDKNVSATYWSVFDTLMRNVLTVRIDINGNVYFLTELSFPNGDDEELQFMLMSYLFSIIIERASERKPEGHEELNIRGRFTNSRIKQALEANGFQQTGSGVMLYTVYWN